jgi:hypothetical protein
MYYVQRPAGIRIRKISHPGAKAGEEQKRSTRTYKERELRESLSASPSELIAKENGEEVNRCLFGGSGFLMIVGGRILIGHLNGRAYRHGTIRLCQRR